MTPPEERPLRIGITCYPTFGGSGIVATEIGLCLARRGHRVHFIGSDAPGRLDRAAEHVQFHAVEAREYPLFDHGTYPLALASKMVEVSLAERLDVLHVHYAIPHATSAYLARQILGAAAPKIVTTLHGTDITLVGRDPGFLPITRFSILASDAITTPSRYLREATFEYLAIPPSTPIEVISNFVDVERYRPPERKRWEVLRPLFSAAEDAAGDVAPAVLVHVSNFRPLKRVDDVVRVFARVQERLPARLVLVGDGPDRAKVEALVRALSLSDRVCFLGEQLDFLEVLQHSRVFLLPSQTESFGLAALEAQACGVPVVASRVGGLPEVVVDGETGFLDEPGDLDRMAAHACAILEDPALEARLSSAARARAVSEFSPAPQVARYEQLFRRLLGADAAT